MNSLSPTLSKRLCKHPECNCVVLTDCRAVGVRYCTVQPVRSVFCLTFSGESDKSTSWYTHSHTQRNTSWSPSTFSGWHHNRLAHIKTRPLLLPHQPTQNNVWVKYWEEASIRTVLYSFSIHKQYLGWQSRCRRERDLAAWSRSSSSPCRHEWSWRKAGSEMNNWTADLTLNLTYYTNKITSERKRYKIKKTKTFSSFSWYTIS